MNVAVATDRFAQTRRLLHFGARISGLVAGLAIGQGSLFAVQTWLVAAGQLAVVASFGFAVAMLSLVQWVADWGGLVLLSRHAVSGRDFRGVWAACAARLLISVAVVVVLALFALYYAGTDNFAAGILWGGLGIAPVWALNLSGFLDGHGKSAHSGPLAGLPWIAASTTIALVFMFSHFSFASGLLIGGAYTAGCVICVLLQYRLARATVTIESPRVITRNEVGGYLAQGGMYCIAEFPKELYGRALILLVTTALGAHVAGIYIYVRQLLSGFAQIIGVIKRVEFLALAKVLAAQPLRLRNVLQAQIVNIGTALLICAAALLIFSLRAWLSPQFAQIAYYLVFFAATLPVWAFASSLGQLLILQHRMRAYTAVTLICLAISAALTLGLTPVFGIVCIAAADIAMNLVQIVAFRRIAARS